MNFLDPETLPEEIREVSGQICEICLGEETPSLRAHHKLARLADVPFARRPPDACDVALVRAVLEEGRRQDLRVGGIERTAWLLCLAALGAGPLSFDSMAAERGISRAE